MAEPVKSKPFKQSQRGVNFKHSEEDGRKMMLIHPETFIAKLNALPVNEHGWVEFNFKTFRNLSVTNQFAVVWPKGQKPPYLH